jgi:DNA polymerase bacteriophage-type
MHAHIDFETRSTVDLAACGVHVYADPRRTEVLCMAYAIGEAPVKVWRPEIEPNIPAELADFISSGGEVYAHNANFELAIWEALVFGLNRGPFLQPRKVFCTMAMAQALALPAGLDMLAKVLGLPIAKDEGGRQVMMMMTKPRANRKTGVMEWHDEPGDRDRLAQYCATDVEVERLVTKYLPPLSPEEREVWLADYAINKRGIAIDLPAAHAAKAICEAETSTFAAELLTLTGGAVESPGQVAKMLAWLATRGIVLPSLRKAEVATARKLISMLGDEAALRVIDIRLAAAKASVKKCDAMIASATYDAPWLPARPLMALTDGRARGLFTYHGASTGRWAGRRIQPQNLPRSGFPEASANEDALNVLAIVKSYPTDVARPLLAMTYGNAMDAVSWSLRQMLVAAPKKTFVQADFSNIEGRVLAWLAGEDWKLDAFRAYDAGTGPDLYKVSYSRAYSVAVDTVTKLQRQNGKYMELAFGFQGGDDAIVRIAALFGVTLDVPARDLKNAWRKAHPATTGFWKALQAASIEACDHEGRECGTTNGKIVYFRKGPMLYCRLPSGRLLAYAQPSVADQELAPVYEEDDDGNSSIRWEKLRADDPRRGSEDNMRTRCVTYGTAKGSAWFRGALYGGLAAENATQAAARDLLSSAILRCEAALMPVVLHAHDEIVVEIDEHRADVKAFEALISTPPAWAMGLPIVAEGWTGRNYRK